MKGATKKTRRPTDVGFKRMRFWERLRVLFVYPAQTGVGEPDRPKVTPKKGLRVVRLNAASKVALSKALSALEQAKRGGSALMMPPLFSPRPSPPSEWGQDSTARGLSECPLRWNTRSSPRNVTRG